METRSRYETELIDKIQLLPDYLMPELLNFIDNLALKKKDIPSKTNIDKIMEFAGAWSDLDDFYDFMDDINSRRTNVMNSIEYKF